MIQSEVKWAGSCSAPQFRTLQEDRCLVSTRHDAICPGPRLKPADRAASHESPPVVCAKRKKISTDRSLPIWYQMTWIKYTYLARPFCLTFPVAIPPRMIQPQSFRLNSLLRISLIRLQLSAYFIACRALEISLAHLADNRNPILQPNTPSMSKHTIVVYTFSLQQPKLQTAISIRINPSIRLHLIQQFQPLPSNWSQRESFYFDFDDSIHYTMNMSRKNHYAHCSYLYRFLTLSFRNSALATLGASLSHTTRFKYW